MPALLNGRVVLKNAHKFDCRLVRLIFFVVVNFHKAMEWPQNQILIPDWTYFYCPGTTLLPYSNAHVA